MISSATCPGPPSPRPYRRLVEGAHVTVDNKSPIEAGLREQLTDLLIRFDRPQSDTRGRPGGSVHEHSGPWSHTPLHIPRFEPLFVDLQSLPDEELHGGVRAVVALLFLKYLARRIDREAAQRWYNDRE